MDLFAFCSIHLIHQVSLSTPLCWCILWDRCLCFFNLISFFAQILHPNLIILYWHFFLSLIFGSLTGFLFFYSLEAYLIHLSFLRQCLHDFTTFYNINSNLFVQRQCFFSISCIFKLNLVPLVWVGGSYAWLYTKIHTRSTFSVNVTLERIFVYYG